MAGTGAAAMAMTPGFAFSGAHQSAIEGARDTLIQQDPSKGWVPVSDRKIRVGIVGYGHSRFGASFGFQNHPNVEIVAVSDLLPDRCAELAKVTNCKKTYPSLEELVKDKSIEAVFVATDPPNHPKHCIEVLKHGKHAATAVPVTYGSIE
ncbi:MAG TPA: gfo/Idh/MocA family oxidoreductase, partial [Bacteroidales bacterium]|nr:gfo/Idh/MocA family oxidoreductase [Bacteroidales bacterium]